MGLGATTWQRIGALARCTLLGFTLGLLGDLAQSGLAISLGDVAAAVALSPRVIPLGG
jgi:hypothetical protein